MSSALPAAGAAGSCRSRRRHRRANALQAIEIGHRADVYTTLEAIFVKRHEHMLIFAQARPVLPRRRRLEAHADLLVPLPDHAKRGRRRPPRRVQEALAQPSMRDEAPQIQEQELRLSVSDSGDPAEKDFAQMSAAEIAEVTIAKAEAAAGRTAHPPLPARRQGLAPRHAPHLAEFPRTGGDHRHPKAWPIDKPAPIVALLDISGSMSEYTRLFLHFLPSPMPASVSVFLFGTR
jgi:uncharacterized protein with von Willebrand factor type A (vWA) domain